MTSLILTRGLPASGKSTWAQAWVAEDPENRVRVNRDDIRMELFGVWVPQTDAQSTAKEKEDRVTTIEHNRINNALRQGKDVVSDNTNLNPKSFSTFGKIARQHNIPLTHKDFPVDIKEAIRRNNNRDRVVPASVIQSMADRYMGPNGEFHLFPGDYPVKPFVAPEVRRHAIGFDMDGTLSDTRPIQHYVRGKKYRDFDSFHRSSLFTKPNRQVLQMAFDAHEQGLAVIITTARNEAYREVTQKWLDDLNVPYENIFMRADGDFRPDYVVKKEMLKQIRQHYDVVRFVDDNPQAVSNWIDNGYKVTVVPGFDEEEIDYLSERQIDNVFRSGKCARCGRTLKGAGPLGPECAKVA